MDNTEEINKFLETHSLPGLNQEETDNLKRLITGREIEFFKKVRANKSPELDGFTGQCYQTYKEELIPIFLKRFNKTKGNGTLQVHSTSPPLP